MLSKIIILWWLAIDRFTIPFDFIAPNIMTAQNEKGSQGIWANEAFEHKNAKSDFKCCDYQEKWKTICQATANLSILRVQGAFSHKVAPDIDDFTDESDRISM